MANIKPIQQSADKWNRRTSAATADYANGAANPRRPWGASTIASEKNYETGVQASIVRKSFAKGVRKVGDAGWQNGVAQKGASRFPEGVSLATGKYTDGYGPYQAVIAGLTLPERGPKGSPQNLQRVNTVATALRTAFEKKA